MNIIRKRGQSIRIIEGNIEKIGENRRNNKKFNFRANIDRKILQTNLVMIMYQN